MFNTVSHFIKLPREDEKQEQERDFKPISFFFFFESRSKIEVAGDG